jgi:hypothetical protein
MDINAVLDDSVNAALDGADWREMPVQLDEYGCDMPRYCKFYGHTDFESKMGFFCDRSCSETPE